MGCSPRSLRLRRSHSAISERQRVVESRRCSASDTWLPPVGHVASLGHSRVSDSLMQASYSGSRSGDRLGDDDEAGITAPFLRTGARPCRDDRRRARLPLPAVRLQTVGGPVQ